MRAARIILAIVLPIVAAVTLDALWPHQGADRAFVFLVAVALSIALAFTFAGRGQYTPSVKRAIDEAQVAPAAGHERGLMGCIGPGLVIVICLLVGLVILISSICGGSIK